MKIQNLFSVISSLLFVDGFSPSTTIRHHTHLMMALDDAMLERLNGINRSYQAMTERLGDPDVIADSQLLMKIMSDRSKSEDVVNAYNEVCYKLCLHYGLECILCYFFFVIIY